MPRSRRATSRPIRSSTRSFSAAHCHGWPELAARLDALSWDEIVTKSGVSKREIDDMAAQYAASRAGRVRLDDGRHAPPPRRGDGAGDRAAGPHAADGGAARRRPPADPRPFQHPGHGHRRRHAHAQEGDLRPAGEPLRREAADDEGLRHARMPRRRRRGKDAVRLLPRRQPLRCEPRRDVSPGGRWARSTRSST